MRINNPFSSVFLSFFAVTCLANPKIDFWDAQQKGANFFNDVESKERFIQAKSIGVDVVRLVFNKWESNQEGAKVGDFLLGPKDKFVGLVKEDLSQLIKVLDWADEAGVKVVLTNLSLPGLRWIQHNLDSSGKRVADHRLWTQKKYRAQAMHFWTELALALKNHPAVVGYNILNEPHPELVPPKFLDWYLGDYRLWQDSIKGTLRDLNRFNREMAQAIRKVDKKTPIVVDSGFYATPYAFKILEPLDDKYVLYSFHMYEPYAFTSFNNTLETGTQRFFYPNKEVPIGESIEPPSFVWNQEKLSELLNPIREWAKKHKVGSNRIFASEFGGFRVNNGMDKYLSDLMGIFNSENWHWAFYSFREDSWAGMDYELGSEKLKGGLKYPLKIRMKHYKKNSMFSAILEGLKDD